MKWFLMVMMFSSAVMADFPFAAKIGTQLSKSASHSDLITRKGGTNIYPVISPSGDVKCEAHFFKDGVVMLKCHLTEKVSVSTENRCKDNSEGILSIMVGEELRTYSVKCISKEEKT